jgi:hypothetical protein
MRNCISPLLMAAAGVGLAALLSGCAQAPEAEFAAAKAAFAAAKNAGADQYMANNFGNLQKAMEATETEMSVQKGKSALSRNYKRAGQLIKNVTDLANQITAETPRAREEMTKQGSGGLVSTRKMVDDTRADLKKSAKSKEKKVMAKMTEDLESAEGALTAAEAAFKADNIPEAGKKIAEAQGFLKKIFDKLSCNGVDGLM